jgi:DNA-binding transcriptional LysR family regulator
MRRVVAAATPGMVRLLPDLPRVAVPVWLITHRDLQGSPRIRAVLSILAQDLGGPAPGQTPG